MNSLRPKVAIAQWIACCFFAAVVLIQLGLVGLGQWLPDEYDDFGRLAREGWPFLWNRLKWSPRPLSELLFCAYGWVVNHVHRPLIGTFLGILWAGLIMAGQVTFWQNRRKVGEGDVSPDLPVALALLALLVVGGGRTVWVFYWPAAAVAYLPTLAATMLLFLQVAGGRLSSPRGRAVCSACLIVAACASETGAIFVLCYGLVQALHWGVIAFRERHKLAGTPFVWWLFPTAISVIPLLIVRLNRFHATEWPGVSAGPTKAHPLASLMASVQELTLEILGRSAHFPAWHGLGSRILPEILLALGVALCWSRFGRLSREVAGQIVAVVAALGLASLLSIAAANLHFGAVCCDQHEAVRRCWILMSVAGIGMLLPAWIGQERWQRCAVSTPWAYVCLCAALLSLWPMRPVLQTYRMYSVVRKATERNFQAGFDAQKHMAFLLLPKTLIAQPQVAPGNYAAQSEKPLDVQCILTFFKKSSMVALPPTEWLDDRER